MCNVLFAKCAEATTLLYSMCNILFAECAEATPVLYGMCNNIVCCLMGGVPVAARQRDSTD
jgi:hypothetical protein